MTQQVEFGLDTFGDVTVDDSGETLPYPQVIRNVVAEAVLADSLGIDFIGIGEHHRDDYAISSPEVVLAAIAAQTSHIKLGSAVTVLSSDDPIRVFQRFATLDAVSNGRAEVILGRGSFTESFPLFGYELDQYSRLFEEKLDLFAALLKEDAVTWSGSIRPPLVDQHVYPKTAAGSMRTWIGVGGSPESVVRAAKYGLPLMLAVIGGASDRFRPYVDLYHRALAQFGHETQPIGIHSPGYVAETDEQAREELWPHNRVMFNRIGRDRGWGEMTRQHFDQEAGPQGSTYVGSPETVAQKIAHTVHVLGLSRFDLKYTSGPLPHENMMNSIRLYGEQVIPRVRELLAEKAAADAPREAQFAR
ncbi:LLM class flavin-dependent oxidoreductase [Marisediminicola senii]|uniref:LLM class flavin-dependent oxidoreductase n=1 Tax=Marisediminicola senii TaxID=2711233 RepID=UPI0013EB8439|nr:LLM class flavin-dependent oxidoreductase [Marisediminicola senii]